MSTTTTAPVNSKYPRAILKTWPKIPEKTLELFPITFARTRRAIPVFAGNGQVTVAIDDPDDPEKIEAIQNVLPHQKVIILLAQPADMDLALTRRYSAKIVDSGS